MYFRGKSSLVAAVIAVCLSFADAVNAYEGQLFTAKGAACTALSPDGRYLVVSSTQEPARVWRINPER